MGEARVTIVDSDQPDLIGKSWTTDDDGIHHTVERLTFDRVRHINGLRVHRWHLDNDGWSGADWSNAMQGEAGEAGNVVKKLRRHELGLPGNGDLTRGDLLSQLADEIADTFIYLDLLAAYYGVDIPSAVVRKFNTTSERQGFPERLP